MIRRRDDRDVAAGAGEVEAIAFFTFWLTVRSAAEGDCIMASGPPSGRIEGLALASADMAIVRTPARMSWLGKFFMKNRVA
jgi:hypothetical protein